MCVLNSLAVSAKNLNSNQINEFIIPVLARNIKDRVANVRFFTIKLFEIVVVLVDNITKDKIKRWEIFLFIFSVVKELTTDEDLDVKFFASKFNTI